MADNWFQNWNQPANVPHQPLVYDQIPFNHVNISSLEYSPTYRNPQVPNRPDNYLPYLLSLTLLGNQEDLKENQSPIETTGPFTTSYHWNVFDFVYPSKEDREAAILFQEFIPKNNYPLGVEVYKNRMFLTNPKWKSGIPASLVVVPKIPKEKSPALIPYPSWDWHRTDTCDGITSVFRVQADSCGRLWVLDSGKTQVAEVPEQLCPPQLLIFDLRTDELITRYVLPEEFVKADGLFANILVDVRDDCTNVHAYLTDIWRFNLVVFSLEKMRGWMISDHLFFSDPLAAAYKLHNLEFDWTDGLIGMALSPYNKYNPDRILYFNPMTSFREFYVATSVIQNETGWKETKNAFRVLGQSRGPSSQIASSWMDKNGIMFYNLVTRDSIGCWDSRKPYKRANLGVVAKSSKTLVFPNDIKIDEEPRQSIWVLTNALPYYYYGGPNENTFGVRILRAYADEAVRNTICDPRVSTHDTYIPYTEENDCYF